MPVANAVAQMTLRQSRRGAIGWLAGFAGLTLLYISSYKSVAQAKSSAINDYPESLKKALNLEDLTSPVGYLNSTAFGIPLLLLTTVLVITMGTRALAADEESGAMELILSYPLSRANLVLGRMAAMVSMLVGVAVVLTVVTLAMARPVGLSIGVAYVLAATFTWLLFACCLGSLALLASAAFGRRSTTTAVAGGAAVFAYLAASFLPLVDGLSWVRHFSPYNWFIAGNPLGNGLNAGYLLLLLGTTVVATYLAALVLDRRDINT
jgi:ABC-2 type transport system permease protein